MSQTLIPLTERSSHLSWCRMEDHFSLTHQLMHHKLNFWKAQNFFDLMESALDHIHIIDDKFFTEDVNEKVLAIMDEMDILVDQYKKPEQYTTPEALTGLQT